MKRLFLLVLSSFIVFISQAQIKKGDILLGGNIGFSDQSSKTDPPTVSYGNKSSSFSVSPSFGCAIRDNLVLGVDLAFTHQKTDYSNPDYTNTANSYGAGGFLRRYKYLGSGFYIFGQSRLGFFYSTQKTGYPSTPSQSTEQKEFNAQLGFYPGIAFGISRHWQIETGFPNLAYINYDHLKKTDHTDGTPDVLSSTNSFIFSSSLSNTYTLSVGLRYFIGS